MLPVGAIFCVFPRSVRFVSAVWYWGMGEDEQRPLAERVAKFLPRVNANYTIIDTKEHELKGISPEFRGTISHLVMHGVNNRVDAYMELFLRHPLSIRRYYRQFDY